MDIYIMTYHGYRYSLTDARRMGVPWRELNRARKCGSDDWCERARAQYGKSVLDMTDTEVRAVPLLRGENIHQRISLV